MMFSSDEEQHTVFKLGKYWPIQIEHSDFGHCNTCNIGYLMVLTGEKRTWIRLFRLFQPCVFSLQRKSRAVERLGDGKSGDQELSCIFWLRVCVACSDDGGKKECCLVSYVCDME